MAMNSPEFHDEALKWYHYYGQYYACTHQSGRVVGRVVGNHCPYQVYYNERFLGFYCSLQEAKNVIHEENRKSK